MRIKLTVAYDGTNYVGYQSQTNGVAIQDVLEKALTELFHEPIRTMNASRTDTGVHAEGNVSVFDVETRIAPSKLAFAINARLPEDIRIVSSEQVADDFHPRFQRTVKTYEYHILNRTHPDPTRRLYEWHVYGELDVQKMDKAAKALIGTHDFASFCAAGSTAKTTVREIYDASVTRQGNHITFRITGSGFLYNMVRILAGTLVEIGKGYFPENAMPAIIEARDRKAAGPTAIPKGLVLQKIVYPEADSRIRRELMALRDENYAAFSAKLIPHIEPATIIGIRKPTLRAYAKDLLEGKREYEEANKTIGTGNGVGEDRRLDGTEDRMGEDRQLDGTEDRIGEDRQLDGTEDKSDRDRAVSGIKNKSGEAKRRREENRQEISHFLDSIPHTYLEENDLQMELIRQIPDFDEALRRITEFLPYVDNWETCDMVHPKVFDKQAEDLLPSIRKWLSSARVYERRYAVNLLMSLFLDDRYHPSYPAMVAKVKNDDYYIMMSCAWYFATALAKQYDSILPYLEKHKLDKEVHNKTIRKAIESYRITAEQKAYLRTLKR